MPNPAPWPEVGYVSIEQMMAALAGCSHETVYNYVREELLPRPVRYGPNRVGWRVDVGRRALAELPQKVAELNRQRAVAQHEVTS